MALVKLKRSWFNWGTILTSHVCLAVELSLCLQITWIGTRRSLVVVQKSRAYDAESYELHARLAHKGSYLQFLSSPLYPS